MTGQVPYLTAGQMAEVDRAMVEDFHIELIQMLENAGRSLAHLARARFLAGNPDGKQVTVLAGTGATAAGPWRAPAGCTPGARGCTSS